jgi:hypothetical protein
MLKNFARLLAVGAFAVVMAAVPTTASASGGGGGTGLILTIGNASLQGRVLATVPVTVTCTGALADTVLGSGSVNVFIQQAYGKSVSHGNGVAFFTFCSSSPQTINVLVTPDSFTTPPSTAFHGGAAAVTAFAGAVDSTFTIFEGGSAGPQIVKL